MRFILSILLLLSPAILMAGELSLVGRALPLKDKVLFSAEERAWIAHEQVLSVGVILPAYEPFEVISSGGTLEGISADVLRIIAQESGLKIRVQVFEDEHDAWLALEQGRLDLINMGSSIQIQAEGVTHQAKSSHAFLRSKMVFSTLSKNVERYRDLSQPMKVAVSKNVVDFDKLHKLYPNLRFMAYTSPLSAMDAVYFGEAELLLSDLYSVHYLAGERFGEIVFLGNAHSLFSEFGFHVTDKKPELQGIINKVIDSLQDYGRGHILNRWRGALSEVISTRDDHLFDQVRRHEVLRVAVNVNAVPYSFIGHEGKFVGIAADVLRELTKHTRQRLEVLEYASYEEAQNAVLTREADVLAKVVRGHLKEGLVATLDYNRDDISVLTAGRNSIDEQQRFVGHKIAVSEEYGMAKEVSSRFPTHHFVLKKNSSEALAALFAGEVDGAVTSLFQVKFDLFNRPDAERYKVLKRVSEQPLEIAFGVAEENLALRDALNQALLSIPSSELARIGYQWRTNPLPQLTIWERYGATLAVLLCISLGLLLLHALNTYYLENKLKERERLLVLQDAEKCRAEAASKAKSNFMAMVSHELRTPLHIILGFIDVAMGKARKGEVELDALVQASTAADSLLELINNVLDLTGAENAKIELHEEVVSLNTLLRPLVKLLEGISTKHNNRVVYVTQVDDDYAIRVDPVRLKQIIYNLAGNAIKFTRYGTVTIRVSLTHDVVSIEVSDDGIGIPAEKLPNIFEPFCQAQDKQSEGTVGSGLGLTIVKKLCELMGGEITLHSEVDVGTTVRIDLPLERVAAPCQAKALDKSDEQWEADTLQRISGRILIVDDHKVNTMLMQRQFLELGIDVDIAHGGAEALDLYERKQHVLVITDCQMPGMHGFELTQRLRELQQTNGRSLVIMGLTASGVAADVQEAKAAGMDDCLFKPIKIEQLIASMSVHCPQECLPEPEAEVTEQDWRQEIWNEYHSSNAEDMALLWEAFRQGDMVVVRSTIHRIKGAARMLGVTALATLCEEMEESDPLTQASISRLDALIDNIGTMRDD